MPGEDKGLIRRLRFASETCAQRFAGYIRYVFVGRELTQIFRLDAIEKSHADSDGSPRIPNEIVNDDIGLGV